jgi:hypothetical protein
MRADLKRLAAAVLLGGLAACGGEPGTPEARVRAWLETGQAAAEARDVGALKDMIAEDYQDEDGHDKQALVNYIRALMLRNQVVHVFMDVESIEMVSPEWARVSLVAALAGRKAEQDPVWQSRADLYRFELEILGEDGDFELVRAEWRSATR